MCPEKAKINLNKTAVIACLIMILILVSGFLIYRFLMLRPIPELKRIADLEGSHFEATFISFDGDKLTSISHHAKTLDVQFSDIRKIRRFCNLKGTKVTDWTPDKIKYPVCSLTIRPINFKSEKYESGETVVWSNGYLITSTGDVYRCNPDFSYFSKSDDGDHYAEATGRSIENIKYFRPLAMANKEWNKDLLRPSEHRTRELNKDIEAKIKSVTGEEAERVVTVSFKNNGSEIWNYSDQPLFVGLEVKIDGEYYCIYHDPSIDDIYLTALFYSKSIGAGRDDVQDYNLGFFGKVPSGEYRIVLFGKQKDVQDYALAEFSV